MSTSIKIFSVEVKKLNDRISTTEPSYYPAFCKFLHDYAKEIKWPKIEGTPCENTKTSDSNSIGFPDITVRNDDYLIGWIEIKPPHEKLSNKRFDNQFKKYKESLENIIFTNLNEWQLWQWDESGKSQNLTTVSFDPTCYKVNEEKKLENLIFKFFEGKSYEARTPKQLALALARKSRLLSRQVEESITEAISDKDKSSDLLILKDTFEKTLIQDITEHQFANMFAETLTYSLFLASLENYKRHSDEKPLTISDAVKYLPPSIPILSDLFSLTSKVSERFPAIHSATIVIVEQLNHSDIRKIYSILEKHKPGDDPVIQFYEPFLQEYDPKEREARGVYYTPKPVVDYIVRSVDYLLKDKFAKKDGLADDSVHLLDPACGTGTFLMSAIQQVQDHIENKYKALGNELVKKQLHNTIINHILKHFYGFELLVAPYAVAHLKLTLLLEELGFNFAMTKGDDDPDNDRVKVYLANTLDDPNKTAIQGDILKLAYKAIPEESEKARKVKKEAPVLVIIGNPPYSVSSSNSGDWINNLMKTYKTAVKSEKNIQPLSDDYIKFIRFGQWKIEQTGQGILAMITNHSFLSGLIHRGMREELLKSFDQIFVIDLHGNSTIGEINPDGGIEQNVFNIQQGVSISFFIKQKDCNKKGVWHSELWGDRSRKFDFLSSENISSTKWTRLEQHDKNFFFIPKNTSVEAEYSKYYQFLGLMSVTSVGLYTSRDDFLFDFEISDLTERVDDILSNKISDEAFEAKYKLRTNYFNPVIARHSSKKENNPLIIKCLYRPFDYRYLLYDRNFIERDRYKLMKNIIDKPNISLILTRQRTIPHFSHAQVSSKVIELKCNNHDRNSSIFPLYIYPEEKEDQIKFIDRKIVNPNFSSSIVSTIEERLELKFLSFGRGDLIGTIGPEDLLYYTYSLFYSPTYRLRYSEQHKIDFPKLPLTSNKELFRNLAKKGNELVNLHLLGENPFDNSKTIFNETKKWNLKLSEIKLDKDKDWKVIDVKYIPTNKRVYVNEKQYFEGIEKEVWEFMTGGYQTCEKWLKDRKKAERKLSPDDQLHYMKTVVALRETIRIMKEIDELIPKWPLE